MERSRGGVCRTGGPFPIAFRCGAVSWFKLTHYRLAGGSLSPRDRSRIMESSAYTSQATADREFCAPA